MVAFALIRKPLGTLDLECLHLMSRHLTRRRLVLHLCQQSEADLQTVLPMFQEK
jgi:hypothetical protein